MKRYIFLGDIKADQPVSVSAGVMALCRSGDVVMGNLEGPICCHATPRSDKREPLCSNDSVLGVLKDLNVSIVNIANNHIADFGELGLQETVKALDASKVMWFGASGSDGLMQRAVVMHDIKVVFVGFSHREGPVSEFDSGGFGPTALPSFLELASWVQGWKVKGYFVVVSYHGGEEFFTVPWPRRAEFFRKISSVGADVVLGQHSHSIQPTEYGENGGVIVHGTGNFYFDTPFQRTIRGTAEGMIICVDVEDGRVSSISTAKIVADHENKEINMVEEGSLEVLRPECRSCQPVAKNERIWRNECRAQLLGGLPKSASNQVKQGRAGFIKCSRRAFNCLVRLLLGRTRNRREKDMILGAIPVFGVYWCRRMRRDSAISFPRV